MIEIDLLSTLYTGTRELRLCPSLSVGNTGPAGLNVCSLHSLSTVGAKVSYAAIVLEYILLGRISALETKETKTIYAELWNAEKTEIVERVGYGEDNACHWEGTTPGNSSHIMLPFVLFSLAHNTGMNETKSAFEKCAEDFKNSGSVTPENIYLFCDSFYYEWKANFPSRVNADNSLNLDIIRQAIRADNARIPEIFETTDIADLLQNISIAEVQRVAVAQPAVDQFAACIRGDYKLDYCWEIEQKKHIPDISKLESYIPCEAFYTLVDLISSELKTVMQRLDEGLYGVDTIGENYVNAILCGKPSTGKTSLANALGVTFGMPVRLIVNSKNTEEDNYQGMTKVAESGLRFVETPFLDAYKNGGIIVLEEFNLVDAGMLMGALGQAVENPFILYEDGYKEIRRHPMCVIIATMNPGTQGSREPNEAFTSRLPDVFMLDDPNESQFINIFCKNICTLFFKITFNIF